VTSAATQPLVVVTNWGTHGALALSLLVIAIAIAGFVYWKIVERAAALSVVALLALVAAALAAAWCAPVLFSSDVYAYAAYGELSALGLNPYAHAPPGSHDVLLLDAAWQWGTGTFPICVYGPAFVALMRTLVEVLAPLASRWATPLFPAIAPQSCAPPLQLPLIPWRFGALPKATTTRSQSRSCSPALPSRNAGCAELGQRS